MQNEVITKVATKTNEVESSQQEQLFNKEDASTTTNRPALESEKKGGKGLVSFPIESVRVEAKKYFKGDELAADVWINKYALKDSKGNIYELTPNDMHRRLSSEIARVDKRYPNPMSEDEIFNLLKEFKYIIPQGGPMSGIGNNFQVSSLSNCFVIGKDEGGADS